jgi:elongation factor G
MDMAIIPMIAGSSLKNKGVQFMLDAVQNTLPPADKDSIEGIHPDDADLLEEEDQLQCVPD